jgi:hypothetical protein
MMNVMNRHKEIGVQGFLYLQEVGPFANALQQNARLAPIF